MGRLSSTIATVVKLTNNDINTAEGDSALIQLQNAIAGNADIKAFLEANLESFVNVILFTNTDVAVSGGISSNTMEIIIKNVVPSWNGKANSSVSYNASFDLNDPDDTLFEIVALQTSTTSCENVVNVKFTSAEINQYITDNSIPAESGAQVIAAYFQSVNPTNNFLDENSNANAYCFVSAPSGSEITALNISAVNIDAQFKAIYTSYTGTVISGVAEDSTLTEDEYTVRTIFLKEGTNISCVSTK